MCVTVYSTTRDKLAARLVEWLSLKQVDATQKFIDLSPQWALEYQQIGGRDGRPVSIIAYRDRTACVMSVDRREIVQTINAMY